MRSCFHRSLICWAVALGLVLALVSSAAAVEPYLDFPRCFALHGYGEIAIDYVNQLRTRPDVPEDIKLTLDLEMASSLRTAAAETVNADEKTKRLAEANLSRQVFEGAPRKPTGGRCLCDVRRPVLCQRHDVAGPRPR